MCGMGIWPALQQVSKFCLMHLVLLQSAVPALVVQVLLLENTRFHKEEEKNDKEFAKQVRC